MEIDTTPLPGRVVVGVDGSWNALGAVTWAAAEARLRGTALHIVHAVPGGTGGSTRAQDVLDRAFETARRAEPDLTVTAAYVDAAAGPALLDAADGADLLVVGTAERDRTEEVLLGSVALHVSGRASSPVVVVRGGRRLPGGDGPVLVGVDTADPDTADPDGPTLTAAFDEARRHGSGLVVLHVRGRHLHVHGAEEDGAAHIAAWNGLCDALEPWSQRYPDVPVDVQVVRGDPTREILAAAETARIVVLGSRGRSAPLRALFGSTSREVLRRCPVPVVVVSPAVGHRPVAVAAGADLPIGQASARTERDHPHDPDRLW